MDYYVLGFMALAVRLSIDICMFGNLFTLNDELFSTSRMFKMNRYLFITIRCFGYLITPYVWPLFALITIIQILTGKIYTVELK